MSTFRSFKHRSFALLWTGQTLSRLGDFVYEIALTWWILQKTGSADVGLCLNTFRAFIVARRHLAWSLSKTATPRHLDEYNPRRAAIMLGIYGLHLPLWILIVAALINGIALQAGSLAWTTILQEKIPNEQLGRVSSIDQMGSIGLMPVGLYIAGLPARRGTHGPDRTISASASCHPKVGLI